MEAMINIVRDIDSKDRLDYHEFIEALEDYFAMSEINHNVSLPEDVTKTISNEVYDIFNKGDFNKFRGEVLEFFMVYLEKTIDNKIYHEPRFYHKKTRLFKVSFPGSNCLIDVVKVDNNSKYISLIECKANINNNIKKMEKKFKNKLKHMDALEKELSNYINYDQKPIKVSKTLASISEPVIGLPNSYRNYKIINLYSQFKLTVNN